MHDYKARYEFLSSLPADDVFALFKRAGMDMIPLDDLVDEQVAIRRLDAKRSVAAAAFEILKAVAAGDALAVDRAKALLADVGEPVEDTTSPSSPAPGRP